MIERLGLIEDPNKFSAAAPSKCFGGSYKGAAINVVTNGKCSRFGVDQIGTVAAGLSTWLSVEVCVCVCVWMCVRGFVCVCERERARKRD